MSDLSPSNNDTYIKFFSENRLWRDGKSISQWQELKRRVSEIKRFMNSADIRNMLASMVTPNGIKSQLRLLERQTSLSFKKISTLILFKFIFNKSRVELRHRLWIDLATMTLNCVPNIFHKTLARGRSKTHFLPLQNIPDRKQTSRTKMARKKL